MTDKDIHDFFANIRSINKEHLEPADAGYKLVEEYKQDNDYLSVRLLRDAYKLLMIAFKSGDRNLDEYANALMKARLRTIFKLLITRIIDLVTIMNPFVTDIDKDTIKKQLNVIFNDLSDIKKELDAQVSNERLKEIVKEWEGKRDEIEKLCKKYHMGDIDALRHDAKHGGM